MQHASQPVAVANLELELEALELVQELEMAYLRLPPMRTTTYMWSSPKSCLRSQSRYTVVARLLDHNPHSCVHAITMM